jgi:hypothetical protein
MNTLLYRQRTPPRAQPKQVIEYYKIKYWHVACLAIGIGRKD